MVARLERRAAVQALLAERKDALVVTGLGAPTWDVYAAGDHDANFYLWGAMGGAALMGLGLARAKLDRAVLVVTGDGEALMGLGSLATIGVVAPANLTVAVLDNGEYGETGNQRSHTGRGLDLCAVARSCGWNAKTLTTLADVSGFGRALSAAGGLTFAVIPISPGNPPRALPARDAVYLKNRFRAHLGLPAS